MNSRYFGTTVSIAALAGALAFAPAAHARDGNGYAVSPENPHSVQLLVAGRFGTPGPYQSGTDHSLDPIPPLAVSPENPHSVQLRVAGRFDTPTPASNRPYSPTPVVDPENPNSAAITMGIPQV
ncbi:MAG: hypothetical protein P8014_06160 [Acidihalobacter sp.]|uniref:hypothetical protein n=1 Tax=Acidihalobacter sp. TaxID=1872108 RepID=UPI00307F11CD